MSKDSRSSRKHDRYELPGIVYILAFLIGVLLFLLFGEPLLGMEPDPIWIVFLMGLVVTVILIWVWGTTHKKDDIDD